MTADEIFLAAVEKESPHERAAFLDSACQGDVRLRAQVEGLLKSHDAAGSFLNQPLFEPTPTIDARTTGEQPGTTIGPYTLLQRIGEGGMGVVWMAEQTHPVQRKVALKVIKPGMDSHQVIARFEAERQALAVMDHVNIARVFDGGATESGRPYFVMELVRGVPITKYCDDNRLTPRERLELFVPVCQAMQHAHQKGIIHRDIKPSNVMVALYDGKPVPKVIDFGVAKATEQKLTERTLFTQYGTMVGTLEYMSPEQAEMSDLGVDTRSDIYSLGVLVYELLTGSTPLPHQRMKEAAYAEVLRMIKEEEPPKPSTRLSDSGEALASISANRHTEPAKLTKLVRGELDWIVMKALEKDRNRRYETANGFAQDVQRYLADEPVLACPPTMGYRLRKFARRHKGGLAVTASLFLAVTLTAASIGWAVRDRAARADEIAQAEAARSAKLESQIRESLNAARTLLAADKVASARQQLARAKSQLGTDGAALANLAAEVAAGDGALDRFQQFQELIERAHEAEMALRHKASSSSDVLLGSLATQSPARLEDRRPGAAVPLLLEALRRYGVLERDDWNSTLEDDFLGKPQAEQIQRLAYEELLWLADDVLRRGQGHATEGKLSPAAAARQALAYLGKAEHAHRPGPALYALRARCRKALGDEPAAHADTRLAAETPPMMAVDHYLQGQAAYDAKQLDAGVQAFEAALALEPTHYWSLMKLGYCLCDLGHGPEDFTGAARVFTGCLLKRPDHAHAYFCRANAYSHLRRPDKALADLSRALRLEPTFALAWNNRGAVNNELGQRDKAVADFTWAIDLSPKFALALHNRGATYAMMGKPNEAISDYSGAIDLNPKDAAALTNRASAYSKLGQQEKARADCTQAIKLDSKLMLAWYNRGVAHDKLRKWNEAIVDYSQAIQLDPQYAKAWYNRGVIYDNQKEPKKALIDFDRAIDVDSKFALAWYNRGVVHNKLGETKKAIDDYTEAIKLDPDHVPTWTNRGLAHSKLDERDGAIRDLSQAIKLDPKHMPAWSGRGWVYYKQGKFDKAVPDFTTVIEADPEYSQVVLVYRLRAQAYSWLGRYEEARTDFEIALDREPKYAWTSQALAWLLATCPDAKVRNPKKAVELAKNAVDRAGRERDCWRTLGVAHYRTGDWKAAVAALDKALELRAGGHDWLFLAMAHHKLDHHDEARKAYDQAVQWLERNKEAIEKDKAQAEELRRFRAEAEEVLQLQKK